MNVSVICHVFKLCFIQQYLGASHFVCGNWGDGGMSTLLQCTGSSNNTWHVVGILTM